MMLARRGDAAAARVVDTPNNNRRWKNKAPRLIMQQQMGRTHACTTADD